MSWELAFKDRVVIIAGIASGFGGLEAKRFAQEGAKVILVDGKDDEIKRIEGEINSSGWQALAVTMDVTSDVQWRVLARQVDLTFGGIDILINNIASLVDDADSENTSTVLSETKESLGRMVGTDFWRIFNSVNSCVPIMIAAGVGLVVNVGNPVALNGGGGGVFRQRVMSSIAQEMTCAMDDDLSQYGVQVCYLDARCALLGDDGGTPSQDASDIDHRDGMYMADAVVHFAADRFRSIKPASISPAS